MPRLLRLLTGFVLVAASLVEPALARSHHPHPPATYPEEVPSDDPVATPTASPAPLSVAGVPAHVLAVLNYLDDHRAAPPGYVGGRVFHNAGKPGEALLPRQDAAGRPVRYREWDVLRKVPGKNRGAERLVTGTDGSAYYTADHYRTYRKLR